MNASNQPENKVDYFFIGAAEGASVCNMRPKKIYGILTSLFPKGEASDWEKLLQFLDNQDAKYLGHQFACLMCSVKPKDINDALANLFRMMDLCLNVRFRLMDN